MTKVEVKEPTPKEKISAILNGTKEPTPSQYRAVVKVFLEMMQKEDPNFALHQVPELIEDNVVLRPLCHVLVHEMGREAYKNYDNNFEKAMSFGDEVCNGGYIHGVIEQHFVSVDDMEQEMQTICNGYDIGRCFHGVGHGFMYYSENDLPRSIELCKKYEDFIARFQCAQGVYMENFSADGKNHLSEFLKKDDPLYPCAEQHPQFKTSCYYYAPTYYLFLSKNNYEGAFDLCETAEKDFIYMCIKGVGSRAIKIMIEEPKEVEKLCMKAKKGSVAPCIDGMAGFYLNHFNSIEKTIELCNIMEPKNKEACNEAISSRRDLFVD